MSNDSFWFRATLNSGEKTKAVIVPLESGNKAMERAARFGREGMWARLEDDQKVFINPHHIAYVAYGRRSDPIE